MEFVKGSVCAAKGFKAAGIYCGIRKNTSKKDLAMILSDVPCTVAAVYTRNKVFGAPITVTRGHIADGTARGVIVNSGNANTCNADGVEKAEKMCEIAAKSTGLKAEEFVVASTGVIGKIFDLTPVEAHAAELAESLSYDGAEAAAEAILTTDTVKKEVAVKVTVGGKEVKIGGIAKGSGMIHPNMATMLGFITTDAAISAEMLRKALSAVIVDTFNMVSVDGDTSTNDMVTVLANGLAGNTPITEDGADYNAFYAGLNAVCESLARMLAKDGEGATKLIECEVSGAASTKDAKIIAKSVITSSLVKTAMFGADANWGRILCAIGYADASVDVSKVDCDFESAAGKLEVCRNGAGIPFSEELAKKVLSENEIQIVVKLGDGDGFAKAFGCDLSYEYVKINGDYRT